MCACARCEGGGREGRLLTWPYFCVHSASEIKCPYGRDSSFGMASCVDPGVWTQMCGPYLLDGLMCGPRCGGETKQPEAGAAPPEVRYGLRGCCVANGAVTLVDDKAHDAACEGDCVGAYCMGCM